MSDAAKSPIPCPNKASGLCSGKGLNKMCSHGLCRQCCLASSKAEYDRRVAEARPHPKKKWCHVSGHNYEPTTSLAPSSLADQARSSSSTSASLAASSSAASPSESLSLVAPPTSMNRPSAHAMPVPVLWQKVPADAIPSHLQQDTLAAEAARRKQEVILAKKNSRKLWLNLLIWSRVGTAPTTYKITADSGGSVILAMYPQVVHALSSTSHDTPSPSSSDSDSASASLEEHPNIFAEIFDPSLTRWTVIALRDALGPELAGQHSEALLCTWSQDCAMSDFDCLELESHLERLYGVRRTESGYTRKRGFSSGEAPDAKRLQIASDPLPATPTKSASHRPSTPHIMSSPGPLMHDTEGSYFRAAPHASLIPSASRWPVSMHLPFIPEDSENYVASGSEVQNGLSNLMHSSVMLESDNTKKVGTIFPSLFYFCDLYRGAERFSELSKTMKASDAFEMVFPTVKYAESTWSKVRREFRCATEEECMEWVNKGRTPGALYHLFRPLIKGRKYVRPTLPWETLARGRGQALKAFKPGEPLAVLNDQSSFTGSDVATPVLSSAEAPSSIIPGLSPAVCSPAPTSIPPLSVPSPASMAQDFDSTLSVDPLTEAELAALDELLQDPATCHALGFFVNAQEDSTFSHLS
ncbi:hypothetical protein EVG20_g9991 [Dentipellis fragilis]|uniref:Uncharacterized protein n=1 Tax=Dentipellis fragilis TaxID=205917 RepID=A0A4Y9XVE1_9AGAM|nr:hypothetical protein EVG20_g9991 [Dentipellis fragilis]